ncbi:hypothetical protein [Pontibacter cellulosilyticus]|uniref:Uncharacterized protein n=1 Tax=Pontibacter cellulosilyticus TaxID=1720253 RepID=A0A923SIC4_9BACT|nr:hypothetical protein [Pontibacter cellulosilyticus]MBC5992603.1 hypothetical protein [Pontibacter cellulosilyticus]
MNDQTTRSKKTILHLYDSILPELAKHINENIAPVTALFHDFGLERIIDTWTKDPAGDATEVISIDNGNIQQMGLKVNLEGFQRTGMDAFDMKKNLLFTLDRNSYTVGPDKNTTWLEKDYLERWNNDEYEIVASKWAEELIDAVTERIKSLTS